MAGWSASPTTRPPRRCLGYRWTCAPRRALRWTWSASSAWRHDISLRHAEILLVLAMFPEGRSAPELAADLYGDRTRVVTVRAEMSRLRKQLAGLVLGQPYRFAETAAVDVPLPRGQGDAAVGVDGTRGAGRPRLRG